MVRYIGLIFLCVIFLLTIRWPILSVLLLFITPLFKQMLMSEWPIFQTLDVTVLATVTTLIVMSYHIARSRISLKQIMSWPLLVYILLAVFWLMGVTYSSSRIYAFEKSTRFAFLTIIFFLAPIIFGSDIKNIKAINKLIVFNGIVVAVGTILMPDIIYQYTITSTGGRSTFLAASPLSVGSLAGMGLVLVFFNVISVSKNIFIKMLNIIIIGLLFWALIISGSRGPFVGVLLIWVLILIIRFRNLPKFTLPIILVAVVVASSLAFICLPEKYTSRITKTFRGKYELGVEALPRTERYSWVISRFMDRIIFGHGSGSFPVDRGGTDEHEHPHNIFLESIYELGIIGVLLISILLFQFFRRYFKINKLIKFHHLDPGNYELNTKIFMVFLFLFIQALKSGDINDNRMLFTLGGMLIALHNYLVNQVNTDYQIAQEDYQYKLDTFQESFYGQY
jgi:O-antigen ligase